MRPTARTRPGRRNIRSAARLSMVCAVTAWLDSRQRALLAILVMAVATWVLGIPRSAASAHRIARRAASGVPRGATLVTVGRGATGRSIPPGFLGLSFEYWA